MPTKEITDWRLLMPMGWLVCTSMVLATLSFAKWSPHIAPTAIVIFLSWLIAGPAGVVCAIIAFRRAKKKEQKTPIDFAVMMIHGIALLAGPFIIYCILSFRGISQT